MKESNKKNLLKISDNNLKPKNQKPYDPNEVKEAGLVPMRTTGRGAPSNETHRFSSEKIEVDGDFFDGLEDDEKPLLHTQFFNDATKTIVTQNDSPDIMFRYSINFYRGCEHGCIYCYARPTHEYLNLSAGLDFESKIFVKQRAPELLREKLMSPKWEPDLIVMSGVTDCYQPAERHFQLARKCLEVLNEFKNPIAIITKNHLVTRDIDILKELSASDCAHVTVSVTSLDTELARKMEPRTSTPAARLRAIEELAKAGVPVGVNVAPVIPGLTDKEIPQILKAAADAGASSAGWVPVRLPYSVKDLFSQWLDVHYPEKKQKVLNAIRDIRGDKLNDSSFGTRMRGEGPYADSIHNMMKLFIGKYGLNKPGRPMSTAHFKRPPQPNNSPQLSLFD